MTVVGILLLYDNFNRLKEIEYPPAETGVTRLKEKFEYDALGRIKKLFDTANRETVYNYDDANRTISVTNAELETTQTKYNARRQAIEVKDALNQIYTFTYNPFGQILTQTRAGITMSYEYDGVRNRKKRIDYGGRETNYTYDNLNRLTNIEYDGGATNPIPDLQATYAYDDISRLISATNETGTVSFTYDNRNRQTSTTDVFGHLVEYGYDAASNRTQLKLDGSVQTAYVYDDANRLTTLTDEASQNFTFGYDNDDRLISKTLPNSITTTYNYDGMNRLKSLKHQSSTATLFDNQYTYNTANQISQIAELTQTKNFTYDNVSRLTGMTSGAASENYTFDDVGNRNSSHRSPTYNYQPFNKLTSTATANYNYDANGNMVSKAEGTNFWRYGFDYENRLVSASTRKQTVRYKYDALGRRVQRYTVGNKENTKFTYDGLDVVMDDNAGVLTKYQNGLGIDNKLKLTSNGISGYFLQDHLGSTVGLTNSSGTITEQTAYDSFGNAANNLSTRYQFTGREFDNFSGLHYYRARFYDANLGRFISEDPIGFRGGDVNLFGYVKNRPLKYRDPRGLDDADREWENRTNPPRPTPNFWDGSHNESADNECNKKTKCQNNDFKENYTCLPCDLFMIKGFSAHSQAGAAQARNFPNGGGDPYSGGYRHCVGACILTKRYGPIGSMGRKLWDFTNEDSTGLWNQLGYKPNPDNQQDREAEDIGTRLGYTSCETCENSCLSQYPAFNIYDSYRGK